MMDNMGAMTPQPTQISRAEHVVMTARNINHKIAQLEARASLLRDKIAGSEPITDPKEEAQIIPSGLLAILEIEESATLDGLERLDTLLQTIERHF